MSYDNWSKYKISDLCDVGSSKRIYRREYVEKGISFYRSKEIILKHNNQDVSDSLYISEERFDELNSKFGSPQEGDILLTSVGTLGVPYRVKSGEKFYFKDGNLTWFKNLNDKINSKFLYYWLFSSLGQKAIDDISIGSTQKAITIKGLNTIELSLPPLLEQKAIANILSSLDDKIELNNKINKNLEELTQTLYKRWFVDFEFPNEDGEPYKSSGGEMVESELGMIPKGWKTSKLKDIMILHDNKRIPLSRREREKRKGQYPYYGAASLMDYVDDYLFDGRYILLGEDGTVEDKNGYPTLQYVDGKFWVNNHAHVLEAKNGYDLNSLYILLKNTNIRSIITGAVQKKINQTNLKSLKVILPSIDTLIFYNDTIRENFDVIINNEKENAFLSKTRDTLLPRLMNGEIEVPIEK